MRRSLYWIAATPNTRMRIPRSAAFSIGRPLGVHGFRHAVLRGTHFRSRSIVIRNGGRFHECGGVRYRVCGCA